MRRLVFFMHTSLDGFVAGPNGELDWININEEIFDFVATMTDKADTALYGRVTYEMMQSYWPTAGQKPNASKHDKEHSEWYSKVSKVVLSKTMSEKGLKNTTVISDKLADNIDRIKNLDGKNILISGPTASHSLLSLGYLTSFGYLLIRCWLDRAFLYLRCDGNYSLTLLETKTFSLRVIIHYETKQSSVKQIDNEKKTTFCTFLLSLLRHMTRIN